ncbi:MAG: cob(I)yrinic acid a,c-diamide adenosyltransferase [Candidatus Spyradocola sp.]|jgi:cob(I)alamin adenosyltransferase
METNALGLVHLYWGEGKGKTTAAMGLALRALGHGCRVTVVQFLKNGSSGELAPLRTLGAAVYAGMTGTKFVFQMTPEERAQERAAQDACLRRALDEPCDLLLLDEACAAWQLDMVDRTLLQQAVLERPEGREVVLTGRDPAPWMQEAADYSTEMHCHRHPYDRGVGAREGVEF